MLFAILKVTSNVDGHSTLFFKNVFEVHGSIKRWQCSDLMSAEKHGVQNVPAIEFEPNSIVAKMNDSNYCQYCGDILRPNIYLFDDYEFLFCKTREQERSFNQYKALLEERRKLNTLIFEIGAGKDIPTIQLMSKDLRMSMPNAKIIRINPNDDALYEPDIFLQMKANKALSQIFNNI